MRVIHSSLTDMASNYILTLEKGLWRRASVNGHRYKNLRHKSFQWQFCNGFWSFLEHPPFASHSSCLTDLMTTSCKSHSIPHLVIPSSCQVWRIHQEGRHDSPRNMQMRGVHKHKSLKRPSTTESCWGTGNGIFSYPKNSKKPTKLPNYNFS